MENLEWSEHNLQNIKDMLEQKNMQGASKGSMYRKGWGLGNILLNYFGCVLDTTTSRACKMVTQGAAIYDWSLVDPNCPQSWAMGKLPFSCSDSRQSPEELMNVNTLSCTG